MSRSRRGSRVSSAAGSQRFRRDGHRTFDDHRLKLKPDFQSWTIVLHFESSTMELSNGRDKAEAKAMARAAPASLDPIEPLEDVRAFLDGNARPTISDRDRGALIVVTNRDLDIPPAMRHGIVDEIGNRVEQEISVANYGYPSAALEFDSTALCFGRSVEQLGNLAADPV